MIDARYSKATHIHLASAEQVERALTAFVTYDKRLAAAATERGLPVQTPGGPL